MTVNRFFKMGGSSGSPTAAAPAAAAAVRASLEPSDEIAASALENVYDAPDDGQVLVMQVDGPATIYVQGRSKRQAELAAKLDAMMQTEAAAEVEDKILTPLRTERDAARDARAAKADRGL